MRNNQFRLTEAEFIPRPRLESLFKPEHNYTMSINIYLMLAECIKRKRIKLAKMEGNLIALSFVINLNVV